MASIPVYAEDSSTLAALRAREQQQAVGTSRRTTGWVTRNQCLELRFSEELHGHSGCVNRLAWSHDGDDVPGCSTLLASVSDDLKVLVWPFREVGGRAGVPFQVDTLHSQNIFGVGFLPRSNGELVVTGSMDGTVQLHRLDRGSVHYVEAGTRRDGPLLVASHTQTFACHTDRVKDVEVSRHEPSVFWSCSEDGTVRQFDIRMRNGDQNASGSRNVLLHSPNLRYSPALRRSSGQGLTPASTPFRESYIARYVKYQGVNSIRVNPVRPELMAVASQSPHVHVFDRRMVSLGALEETPRVSLRTGFTTRHAGPVGVLVYPVRELMLQRAMPTEVEVDIRPSYVSWGERGDLLVASYSSGPCVTWSWSAGEAVEAVEAGEDCVVEARRSGGSVYDVDPEQVDSYWARYKETVPFDVERSMSDLSRVRTTPVSTSASTASNASDSLRSLKQTLGRLSWEDIVGDVDVDELFRGIASEYGGWLTDDPGRPDMEKEFLLLLWGELMVRTSVTKACDLLYSVAHPLVSMSFEVAGAFILSMVAHPDRDHRWPLLSYDDPDPPEGEWMSELEISGYARAVTRLSTTFWVNRHCDSRRKERTIAARYEQTFVELIRKLVEEQERWPGKFNRGYWTGEGCKAVFGLKLSLVEAGIIEAWIEYFRRVRAAGGNIASSAVNAINTPVTLLGYPSDSFKQLYCYHSNENTDIKEATFGGDAFGDAFVLAASDSGAVCVYSEDGELVCALESDSMIANCVRPHPRLPLLATSGIDHSIKIWSPMVSRSGAGTSERVITDEASLAEFWKTDPERERIRDFGGLALSLGLSLGEDHFLGMLMQLRADQFGDDEEAEDDDDDEEDDDDDDEEDDDADDAEDADDE